MYTFIQSEGHFNWDIADGWEGDFKFIKGTETKQEVHAVLCSPDFSLKNSEREIRASLVGRRKASLEDLDF